MLHDLTPTAQRYASRNGLVVQESLGSGVHGHVHILQGYAAAGATALKVYHARECFRRERLVYERLRGARIREVLGFSVPQFIRADDELLALEMTVVERPYVLDFAGAVLDDDVPRFEDEKWQDWEADKQEMFGERWPQVQAVIAAFEDLGIHILDVNPGNVAFAP